MALKPESSNGTLDLLDRLEAGLEMRRPRSSRAGAMDVSSCGDHVLNAAYARQARTGPATAAAVLVGLVPREGRLNVFLTRRAAGLRRHAGEIAFPGGRLDPGETVLEAALRETREEVGIPAETIGILGDMTPYLAFVGYLVTPIVALLAPECVPRINPHEVSGTFEVPLDLLMEPSRNAIVEKTWDGARHRYRSIDCGQGEIWGITAGILHELFAILRP